MKNVIITGATGMVGNIVLQQCLQSDEVGKVISISRKSVGISNPKLTEIIHQDFTSYENIREHFKNIDAVYFCIGVYTGAVSDEKFKQITVDYTNALVDMVKAESPNANFCLLSGGGADRTEKSKTAFARYKGMAENHLFSNLNNAYSFRPAYIYPVEKRNEPNLMYRVTRWLYPVIRLLGKSASIPSTVLAKAIFTIGLNGNEQSILENKDILQVN